MPKKRESQPVQVWLKDADRYRLDRAAKNAGRSKSDLAREGICRLLDQLDARSVRQIEEERLVGKFTPAALKVINRAKEEAQGLGVFTVGTEHLLLALAADAYTVAGSCLHKAGVSWALLRGKISQSSRYRHEREVDKASFNPGGERALERARRIAARLQDKFVEPEHLLLSLISVDEIGMAYDVLEIIGIDRDELRANVMKLKPEQRSPKGKKPKKS